jgi:hypothetical protein
MSDLRHDIQAAAAQYPQHIRPELRSIRLGEAQTRGGVEVERVADYASRTASA